MTLLVTRLQNPRLIFTNQKSHRWIAPATLPCALERYCAPHQKQGIANHLEEDRQVHAHICICHRYIQM